MIGSIDDEINPIDLAILRLETLSFRVQKYIDNNMVDVAIKDILDPMKDLAQSRGLAQDYIDSMSIVKLDFMVVGFKIAGDRKTSNGIPINKLLEFGWQGGYEIYGNPWLVFQGNSGMVFLNTDISGPVIHPGFKGYNMIFSMQQWGFVEHFAFKLIKQASEYLEETSFK